MAPLRLVLVAATGLLAACHQNTSNSNGAASCADLLQDFDKPASCHFVVQCVDTTFQQNPDTDGMEKLSLRGYELPSQKPVTFYHYDFSEALEALVAPGDTLFKEAGHVWYYVKKPRVTVRFSRCCDCDSYIRVEIFPKYAPPSSD